MIGDVALLALVIVFVIVVAGAYVLVTLFGVGLFALLLLGGIIAMFVGTGALIWYEISSGSPEPRDFVAIAALWILLGVMAYRFRLRKKL
jgi:hypothetical protein